MAFTGRYFSGFLAFVMAFILCAFSIIPSSTFTFKLKSGIDKTNATAIELKSNWEECIVVCSGNPDVPCNITVDEAYTHLEGNLIPNRVLNTSGVTITIQTENGIFRGAQYKRIASGTNYTYVNQVLQ
jgi:hypothetical protein